MALANTLNSYAQESGDQACMVRGVHTSVYSGESATRTLLDKESGATFLFDSAAGIVYTLPAPVVGAKFRFKITTSITSNSAKVITNSASVFLVGGVLSANLTVAASGDFFVANGTTHVAITQNGTDTGGLIGSEFEVECISATQWFVSGVICGSGTNADPFATS
jgi:hypothetical protein